MGLIFKKISIKNEKLAFETNVKDNMGTFTLNFGFF